MAVQQKDVEMAGSVILISGCRRSGTTLMRTVLSGHPDLLVHPWEAQFILDLWERFGTTIHNLPAALDYLASHRYRPESVATAAIYDRLPESGAVDLQTFLKGYLDAWVAGEAENPIRRLVLKDPRFIFHLDLLDELSPGAVTINLIRDPRANVASQRRRWPEAPLIECIQRWLGSIHAAREWEGKHPHRLVNLRFEDLIQTPRQALQNLCLRLDVPFMEKILNFSMVEERYLAGAPGRNTNEASILDQEVTYTGFESAPLDAWRDQLESVEVEIIEYLTREEMRTWGYDPERSPGRSRGFPLRLALERSKYLYRRSGQWVKALVRDRISRRRYRT